MAKQHLAFALKYRPLSFNDVLGQEIVVSILKEAILKNKIHHALLFAGPAGTGKTTLARIVAKAINCQNPSPEGDPCNKCTLCINITNGSSPDVQEIDAASTRGIEDVREMQENAAHCTFGAKYKIFILDEVHQLTGAAANAFLKTLEEPPENVIFILATTDPYKLIPTIRSRCQKHFLRPISILSIKQQISKIVGSEGAEIDEDALDLLARNSKGGMRDALQFLEQALLVNKKITIGDVADVFGGVGIETLCSLSSAFLKKETGNALLYINELCLQGVNLTQIILSLPNFLRDLSIIKNGQFLDKLVQYDQKALHALSAIVKKHEVQDIVYVLNAANEIEFQITRSGNSLDPRLALETLALKLGVRDFDIERKLEFLSTILNKDVLKGFMSSEIIPLPKVTQKEVPEKTVFVLKAFPVFGENYHLLEKI